MMDSGEDVERTWRDIGEAVCAFKSSATERCRIRLYVAMTAIWAT
jgi:hypothetical protein